MLASSPSPLKYGSGPRIGCIAASRLALLAGIAMVLPAATLDEELMAALARAGFRGTLSRSLEARLGRPVQPELADLGRLLFFDKILALHSDNSCAGCHSPTNGWGDSQPIAIGIQNNGVVGPGRKGPRNQRRSPMLLNDIFYPKLMWNGRFFAPSGDPFDNSQGFHFPAPEGETAFLPGDSAIRHLLAAQAFIPPTETTESAGFTGTAATIDPPQLGIFDDGLGSPLPAVDESGFRNEPIRQAVLARLNASQAYREKFAKVFQNSQGRIDFVMVGQAIAEFQAQQVYAAAPLDQYAQGDRDAMTDSQKRGALLFLGKARCASCHSPGNELFSDFENHNTAVPQIAPLFGLNSGNVVFDGPGEDEDFGMEQVTGNREDRYKFRTAPLRNVALSPAFFHNGSFLRLEDAIRYHLNPGFNLLVYNPDVFGVPDDLCHKLGPMAPLVETLDPLLQTGLDLSGAEFEDLVAFVRDGLRDPRAHAQGFCELVPAEVPSGMPVHDFEGCAKMRPSTQSLQFNRGESK